MKDQYIGENLYALIINGILYPIPEITARWILLKAGWEPCESIKRMHDGQVVPLNQCCGHLTLLSTVYKYEHTPYTTPPDGHKITYNWVRPLRLVAQQDTDPVYDPADMVV